MAHSQKAEETHFCAHILDGRISKLIEKPPKLQSYDGQGDLDVHVQYVNNRLNYHHADDAAK